MLRGARSAAWGRRPRLAGPGAAAARGGGVLSKRGCSSRRAASSSPSPLPSHTTKICRGEREEGQGQRQRRRRRRQRSNSLHAPGSAVEPGEREPLLSGQALGRTTPDTRAPWRHRAHPGPAQAPKAELQDGRQAEQEEEGLQCERREGQGQRQEG